MEENESSKGRYKTYSAEFKIAKIEEFMKSGKSEAAFCRDEGICLSTVFIKDSHIENECFWNYPTVIKGAFFHEAVSHLFNRVKTQNC